MRQVFYLMMLMFCSFFSPASGQRSPVAGNRSYILTEENDIDIAGQRIDNLFINVSKHIVILIGDPADTSRLCNLMLPEPFDPSLIIQSPAERNAGFYLDAFRMKDFKAGIRLANGENKPLKVITGTNEIQMASYWDYRYKKYYRTSYAIRGVGKGDTLDITYSYRVPYRENYMRFVSFRIFFHGSLYKERYSMKLHFENNMKVRCSYENNGKPDTTFMEGSKKTMVWQKKALPGCMDEPGAHPYVSLPHLVFTILPNDLYYIVPYTNTYALFPLYYIAASYRENGTIKVVRAVALGTNNNQYRKIRLWVDDKTAEVKKDSTGFIPLSYLNNCIADDFAYDRDIPYYRFIDEYDECVGDNLHLKKLRSISRYNLYSALIYSLKLNYYTVYLADRRSGILSDEYVQPMFESDYLFAVPLVDGSLQYLYPKKGRSGYYINEIPFYFENTKAQLVLLDDFTNYKTAINEKTRFKDMPTSLTGDNFRKSNILVQIDLDSLKTEFTARVNLSGQYSTVTRGLYLFNEKDPTVNPAYWSTIWEVNDRVKVRSKDIRVMEKVFPFKTNINTVYEVPGLILKSENEFTVNLSNWFRFITYKGFSSEGRIQPFFADFQGSDTYSYLLRFNRPVTLVGHPENSNIRNSFGEATIEISQPQPNEILLTARMLTRADRIEASKTNEVEEIYRAVNNLDKAVVVVKTN